ncbi:hypothetical protein BYT27DRAFT_7215563 [Phlegmacium glaucopus]|nr:hypothetical protein BYT27DRAFT_7215563 [Phlegmacium glaucopus]
MTHVTGLRISKKLVGSSSSISEKSVSHNLTQLERKVSQEPCFGLVHRSFFFPLSRDHDSHGSAGVPYFLCLDEARQAEFSLKQFRSHRKVGTGIMIRFEMINDLAWFYCSNVVTTSNLLFEQAHSELRFHIKRAFYIWTILRVQNPDLGIQKLEFQEVFEIVRKLSIFCETNYKDQFGGFGGVYKGTYRYKPRDPWYTANRKSGIVAFTPFPKTFEEDWEPLCRRTFQKANWFYQRKVYVNMA